MKFWEISHAVTMIPGMFICGHSIGIISYRLFCYCSCTYHCAKALLSRKKIVHTLQRIDLLSQLVACLCNARFAPNKYAILLCMLISFRINLEHSKKKDVMLNGLCIILSNGCHIKSLYLWMGVIGCSVISNWTGWQFFHSLMHLIGQEAYKSRLGSLPLKFQLI